VESSLKTYFQQFFAIPKKFGGENLKFCQPPSTGSVHFIVAALQPELNK